MGVLLRWPPLILWAAAHLLLLLDCAGSTSHSLRYFHTAVSEPGQGLPQFITVGYVDDQQFVQYDSDTKQMLPRVPWIRKVEKEDPQYWNRNTQIAQGNQLWYRRNLQTLLNRYNQSGGIHTLQWMYGCELSSDGRKGGHHQYSYDGRDFIAFDKETLTWTAADTGAQVTKRKWDPNMALNQGRKHYLEEECIEWLQRYLDYGNETLLRTEAPVVKVTRKADYDLTKYAWTRYLPLRHTMPDNHPYPPAAVYGTVIDTLTTETTQMSWSTLLLMTQRCCCHLMMILQMALPKTHHHLMFLHEEPCVRASVCVKCT